MYHVKKMLGYYIETNFAVYTVPHPNGAKCLYHSLQQIFYVSTISNNHNNNLFISEKTTNSMYINI